MPLRSRRHVGPIPAHVLQQIFDEERALNRPPVADAPSWTAIAVATLATVALVLFLFFLDGGWIVR